jgi:TonB family protein
MDWLGSIGAWALLAVGLVALAIGLNYALHGLSWCSARSVSRLHRAGYVMRRLEKTDRILCDGKYFSFSPRAQSGRPELRFGVNVAGFARGAFALEVCLETIRAQVFKRTGALLLVVAGFVVAWIGLLTFYPDAAGKFISHYAGGARLTVGDAIFAALAAMTALFLIHTIFPFRFSILPQFGLSPHGKSSAKSGTASSGEASAKDGSSEGDGEREKAKESESFMGSDETLSDLDRFCPLQRKALGVAHEQVLASSYYRSFTLFQLKRFEEALTDIEQYEWHVRALGKRNPWGLKVRYLKAVSLAFMGSWAGALAELNVLEPLQSKVLGRMHPDTLMTRSARVTALSALEHFPDVLRELETLLPELASVFGPEHQFIASNTRLKAVAEEKVGQAQQAAPAAEPPPGAPAAQAAAVVAGLRPAAPVATAPIAAVAPARQPAGRGAGGNYQRAALLAAACLGLVLIGGGLWAGPWLWRSFAGLNAPSPEGEGVASPSDAVAIPLPVSDMTPSAPAPPAWDDALGAPEPEAPATPAVAAAPAQPLATGRDGANVRMAPRTDAPVIERLGAGSPLTVTGQTQAGGHQWFRIALADRRTGFVRGDVVVRAAAAPVFAGIQDYAPPWPMAAGPLGANIRAQPETGAPLVVRLEAGSKLNVNGRTESGGHAWYRVVLADRRVGFARDDVVGQIAPPDGSDWIDAENITWRRRATAGELADAYPRSALARGTSHAVDLKCRAASGGRLGACSALTESTNQEFTAAALRIVRSYRMEPTLQDGTPATGRWVRLRVRFDPPPSR